MASRSGLKPRKKPRQARSAHTVSVILEAAARILEDEGIAAYNSNRIAEIAGVSIGSFYQYFPNKEAVTASLIRQSQEYLVTEIDGAIDRAADMDFEEALDVLLSVLVAYQLERPVLAAALDREEARLPVDDILEKTRRGMMSMLVAFLRKHSVSAREGGLEIIVGDIMTIGRAMTDATIDRPAVSQEDLHRRLKAAVLGYLDRSARQ